jgi:two-component sensor histidine kinase
LTGQSPHEVLHGAWDILMSGPSKTEQIEALLSSPEVEAALETRHFRRFLDHLPIAIAISKLLGSEQRIVYANQAFEAIVDYPLAKITGRRWDILDSFRHLERSDHLLCQAVLDGEDCLGVFRREGSDTLSLIEATAVRIETDEGLEDFRLVALIDVSESYSQREELERSVRERDLLLRELQHRVKNNLQLVAALIRLEARNARDGKPVNIQNIAGRVEALSILYRALSEASSEQELDLGNYLGRIASAAVRSHGTEGVRLETKVDCCPTSINLAMPAGLVVNEVITNALKHAFVGRDTGTIELQCLQGAEGYEISVADDGIGLPPGVVFPPPDKISGLIAQSLYENAGAELSVESRPSEGTRISFKIPVPPTTQEAVLPFTVAHGLMQVPHDAASSEPDGTGGHLSK